MNNQSARIFVLAAARRGVGCLLLVLFTPGNHPPKNSPQSGDWGLTPPKPTRVFEPRYEGYWKKPYTAADWGAWQTRQQAYQSVFAGGCGFTCGHERVFGFGQDGCDWRKVLDAPGASQMRHLAALLSGWSQADYLWRVPDQSLLDGDEGRAQRLASNRLTATRNGDEESHAAKPFATGLVGGAGAPVHEFFPPGGERNGNDWVLVLSDAGHTPRRDGR